MVSAPANPQPPVFYFQLHVPSYGRTMWLKMPFLAFCSFSINLPVYAAEEKLPCPMSHFTAKQKVTLSQWFRSGAGNPKPRQTSPPWLHTKASEDFLSHEVSGVSHPLKQISVETLASHIASAQNNHPTQLLLNCFKHRVERPGFLFSLVYVTLSNHWSFMTSYGKLRANTAVILGPFQVFPKKKNLPFPYFPTTF